MGFPYAAVQGVKSGKWKVESGKWIARMSLDDVEPRPFTVYCSEFSSIAQLVLTVDSLASVRLTS